MTVSIRFIQQDSSDDVTRCISDIELSGGEPVTSSHYIEDGFVDVVTIVTDIELFDTAFKNTNSYQYSNY